MIANYAGMSGTFDFRENVADKTVFLKTIKDGKFVRLEE